MIWGHNAAIIAPRMSPKKRVHVTFPVVVLEALEALAVLRGETLSDLLVNLGRDKLKEHGIGPEITAEAIAAAIERKRGRKKQ